MIGYKVVCKNSGKFYSFGAYNNIIEYKIKERIFPEIGKLFVFDNLDNVKRFIKRVKDKNSISVFMCKYSKSVIQRKYIVPHSIFVDCVIDLYWNNYKLYRRFYRKNKVPVGTVFADWVELLREIKKI